MKAEDRLRKHLAEDEARFHTDHWEATPDMARQVVEEAGSLDNQALTQAFQVLLIEQGNETNRLLAELTTEIRKMASFLGYLR